MLQAAGGKHANAIELQDRVGWPEHYAFEECRLHRSNWLLAASADCVARESTAVLTEAAMLL